MSEKEYEDEWVEYYQYLEELRQSGVTNMFGAAPYLAKAYSLPNGRAIKIVGSWMENYSELLEDGVINRG
jgi:hypothetical protein